MKKLLMTVSSFIFAANMFAAGIGYIDTQIVIQKYPETAKTQAYLETKKADMQKILDEAKKKIEDKEAELDKKGAAATEKEKQEVEEEKATFKSKYEEMQQSLDQVQYTMFEKLKSDINVAIKEVAKEKKMDIVLDKQVVYYGGTDITDDVSKFLVGIEKIDLKK